MQSTTCCPRTEPRLRVVPPGRIVSAFAQVPDPRRRQGRRHPLAAVLALAIAQWAGEQDASVRVALGLPAGKASHQSTLQRLFAKLDPDRLVAALGPAVGGL